MAAGIGRMNMPQFTGKAHLQHWQALLDSAGEGVWGMDLKGRCTFINWMALEVFGFAQEEMVGSDMHLLVHHHYPDGRGFPHDECPLHHVLSRKKKPFRQLTDMMFRKDGSSFVAEMAAEPVIDGDEVTGVVVTFREMTAIRQQQEELKKTRDLAERQSAVLSAVIESVPHGVYIARPDEKLQINHLAQTMSGGRFPQELNTLAQALAGEQSSETLKVGESWIHSSSVPALLHEKIVGSIAINTDVTQARLRDEALRKAEKLAAVGQLASLIAHEINNPLESITNLLYLIQHSPSIDDAKKYSAMAQEELSRVSEITMQTLRFHRQQTRPVELNVGDLLQGLMSLYTGRMLMKGIMPALRLHDIPPVTAIEGEIRQLANNLVRNALDAMPHGGRLLLRVHPETDRHTGCKGVRFTVADTGEGISPEIRAHLFDAFHTTKEQTGTGLGLWVSKGIARRHRGRIRVRSKCGAGTVFAVWLPLDGGTNLTGHAD